MCQKILVKIKIVLRLIADGLFLQRVDIHGVTVSMSSYFTALTSRGNTLSLRLSLLPVTLGSTLSPIHGLAINTCMTNTCNLDVKQRASIKSILSLWRRTTCEHLLA